MHATFIENMGGHHEVAKALKVSPGAVANWKLEGRSVPWRYRPTLAALAEQKGVALPPQFLEAA